MTGFKRIIRTIGYPEWMLDQLQVEAKARKMSVTELVRQCCVTMLKLKPPKIKPVPKVKEDTTVVLPGEDLGIWD